MKMKMTSGSDDYKIMAIADAIASVNQKVNLIGVIAEFDFPRQTRGTDYLCTLKIVDDSHKKAGLEVRVFEESMENLPRIVSAGDLIQLNRVTMTIYREELCAVYNKKFSSFALYCKKDGEDNLPYQVSPIFRPRELDKKFITGLRKWFVNSQIVEGSGSITMMRGIKKGEGINVVCKILHVCEVAKVKWMAFVCDGTDAPPVSIFTRREDEMGQPLPLHLEPLPLPRDVLCTFPHLGTVLRVSIGKWCLHSLNTGKWVKFVNVTIEVDGELWRGVLTPFTKLRYTPDEDNLVLERQRIYKLRLSSKSLLARIPFFSLPWTSQITVVDCKDVQCLTLMDVLTYSEAKDFCYRGTYRIRLTLEDPTARIHAYLYREDGDKFFGGQQTVDELIRKRNVLLGMASATDDDGKEIEASSARNPPWIECCLKSYYIEKSDRWGSRHFRIFDTKVVV